MLPPSECSKISTQSTNDHATDNDFNNSKSEISNFVQAHSNLDLKTTIKNETVGFVKTLLGPSLEDAVLKTLEFGKSLIQKPDGLNLVSNEKKVCDTVKKEFSDDTQKQVNFILEKDKKNAEMKDCNYLKEKSSRKSVIFDKEKDKKACNNHKTKKPLKKLANVSKIRSLDSDLKQKALSPEKIKKQLEALIQINKDVPPEHVFNWNYCPKKAEIPVEMTVMPSFCMYKTDENTPSSCEDESNTSKLDCNGHLMRSKTQPKRRLPNTMCQAPEFLSNALGPTLDVSLIDNIKMMRDIFKCDSARGEEISKRPPICQQTKQEVRFQNSETEMTCRIDELHRKIEELEQKERCLAKQIEDEELERECKRRAFREEEKKLSNMKTCLDELVVEKKKDCKALLMESGLEAKYESLPSKIACEEEKLLRLKAQSENYKREIIEAKNRKEILKRNKILLDAWDVFASRVCHTRLPSFSRAYTLERKEFRIGDTGNFHCCFPLLNPPASESTKNCKSRSRCPSGCRDFLNPKSTSSTTQCIGKNESRNSSRCPSRSESRCGNKESSCSCKNESLSNLKCKLKLGEIQFPVQRDITCGLHQMMKVCSCKRRETMKFEGHICSSEDDLFKRCKAMDAENKREQYYSSLNLESSAELVIKNPSKEKVPCRSQSDTTVKKAKCSRIIKVMWATTRINIFQDNSRTYEIMDATSNAPAFLPAKTEGIFVVKTPQKKISSSFSKRKCQPSVP